MDAASLCEHVFAVFMVCQTLVFIHWNAYIDVFVFQWLLYFGCTGCTWSSSYYCLFGPCCFVLADLSAVSSYWFINKCVLWESLFWFENQGGSHVTPLVILCNTEAYSLCTNNIWCFSLRLKTLVQRKFSIQSSLRLMQIFLCRCTNFYLYA